MEQYGGVAEKWKHFKGSALLDCGEEYRQAEVHWFQQEGIDKIKLKVKRWEDES